MGEVGILTWVKTKSEYYIELTNINIRSVKMISFFSTAFHLLAVVRTTQAAIMRNSGFKALDDGRVPIS